MSSPKKIVLLGHFGVGKTSLMKRFIDDTFSEDYKVTLGVQIQKKVVELNSTKKISLIIWDVEGNTSVKNTRLSYLLGSNGFIYVFDATRMDTFIEINEEIEFLKENYPKAKIKVIGNKLDLVRKQSLIDILALKEIKFDCLTSAKSGENVKEMFQDLAQELQS
jgi:small GTP-binding protein